MGTKSSLECGAPAPLWESETNRTRKAASSRCTPKRSLRKDDYTQTAITDLSFSHAVYPCGHLFKTERRDDPGICGSHTRRHSSWEVCTLPSKQRSALLLCRCARRSQPEVSEWQYSDSLQDVEGRQSDSTRSPRSA